MDGYQSVLMISNDDDLVRNTAAIVQREDYGFAFIRKLDGLLSLQTHKHYDVIIIDVELGFDPACVIAKKLEKSNPAPRTLLLLEEPEPSKIKDLYRAGFDEYTSRGVLDLELPVRINHLMDLSIMKDNLFREIKKRERDEKKLEEVYTEMSSIFRTDPLTKIANRRDLLDKVTYEINRSRRSGKTFSLVLCDIKQLKKFNDDYGYDCGDYVIVEVCSIIKSMIRSQDSLARWEGDKFLLLLPDTEYQGGSILADKIQDSVEETEFNFRTRILDVELLIVCLSDDGKLDQDTLIRSIESELEKAGTSVEVSS